MNCNRCFLLAFVLFLSSPLPALGRPLNDEEYYESLRRRLGPDTGNDDALNDDAPAPSPSPSGCFSEVNTVEELTMGNVAMKYVDVGDKILTKDGKFQTVFAFAHRQEDATGTFLQLHTKQMDKPLEVTGEHLIYLHKKMNPIRADAIQVGDELDTTSGPAKVTKVTTTEREGLYVPLTPEGTLVVDGVVTSSYISFHKDVKEKIAGMPLHDYVHMTLAPFRMICFGVSGSFCQWHDQQTGMPHYISFGVKLNDWIFQQNQIVQILGLLLVVAVTGACWLVESAVGPTRAPAVIAIAAAFYTYYKKYGSAKKVKTV